MDKARILVVEDESLLAEDIQERLKNLGYEVAAVAHSGEEALARVAAAQPDLVLMDIRLKGKMDGIDTTRVGLLGMRERAMMLDGEVTIAGRRGKGTTVRLRIPLVRPGGTTSP